MENVRCQSNKRKMMYWISAEHPGIPVTHYCIV
jgi:hypothetical protein